MVSTSQTSAETTHTSIHSTVSTDTVLASIHQLDAHTIASTFPAFGERFGGPLAWVSLLRPSAFAEVALIVVLFLLIGGLIGVRLTKSVSRRDIELSTLPLVSNTVDASESTGTDTTPTDDHHSYERYLSPETPPELLSDEGEVVRLLVANHGRIRQHQIAEETGWSKSKVSRICSQMHSDGTIEKTSVGRENVITLSDRETTDETQLDDAERPLP
ncbi:helix-turn-helix transcriptional regulator [Natronorubrum halophilum]|uniref:helix-turn-helix transcriptional regulator n=1 Tax=Natronorubrum halophilum TaxID=1702106 RepID=UPI0010C218D9|nr:helix-turn-helix domain-containing protein [Natronorubrum halophilum]